MLVKWPHTIVINNHNVIGFKEREMVLVPDNRKKWPLVFINVCEMNLQFNKCIE